MDDKIVNLFSKEKEATISGTLHCIGCGYKWVAVWPPGVTEFECPECGFEKGVATSLMSFANENQLIRECRCGNYYFILTPEGHLCAKCGTYQMYDED